MLRREMRSSASILLAVPNFSEGRRRDVINSVVSAGSNPMVRILDVHSDPDHNRTVLTMAGPWVALVDAIVATTREAVALIDLGSHEGIHPRIGAMDVVPFVPIMDSTMEDAKAAAAKCAERIAEELGIPCFLYEESARSRDRRTLPDIRSAAFREWSPDLGGPGYHPSAGATVVGARDLLVAFNINLVSRDVRLADRIARKIRARATGLAYVRAMGVELRTRKVVQVSMNLIRPTETTMADAFDAVSRAAEEQGVDVLESELVGLAPSKALGGRNAESLRLRKPPKILEEELARAFRRSRAH